MAFFAWRMATGALVAMRRAVAIACDSTSSGGQSRLTMPQASASLAEKGSPVKMISFARRAPMLRGRCCVPPPPGMMPRVTSVKAKRAPSAA